MTFFTLLQNRTGVEPDTPPPSPGGLGGGGWGGLVYQAPHKRRPEPVEIFPVSALVTARARRPDVEVTETVQVGMSVTKIESKGVAVLVEIAFSPERAAEEEILTETLAVAWSRKRR